MGHILLAKNSPPPYNYGNRKGKGSHPSYARIAPILCPFFERQKIDVFKN